MFKNSILVADLLKNQRHISKLMRRGKCIYQPLQEYKEITNIKARLTLTDGSTVDIPFTDENDHTLYSTETSGYRSTCKEAIVYDGVTTLDRAFGAFSAMTSITITDNVTTTVGANMLCDCHVLKRVNSNVDGVFNLPKNLSGSLNDGAVARCYQMETVVIPTGVTSIGNYFAQCNRGVAGKLKSIIVLGSRPSITTSTFNDTPSNGVIYHKYGQNFSTWLDSSNLGQYGWTSRPCDYIAPMTEPLHFIAQEDGVSITPVSGLSYSRDGKSWATTDGTVAVNLNTSETLYLKGSGISFSATSLASATSGKMNVRGNVHSVIYGDDFLRYTKLTDNYALDGIFRSNSGLTDAIWLNLPATALTQHCYEEMFAHCTSLTGAPRLAEYTTPLSAYSYCAMFYQCTSLKNAPILRLSGTPVNQCCRKMFNGCSSLSAMALTFVPNENRTFEWVSGVKSSGRCLIEHDDKPYITLGTVSTTPVGWSIITSTTGGTGSSFNASRAS